MNIVKKHNLKPNEIKENYFFENKILKKSKGSLKLLNVGELTSVINIEVSFSSKKAIEKVKKLGGSVILTKKN